VLPRDAGGDISGGGAMLDARAEALFVGRSEDNEAGGGTILGAGVEAHGSIGGAVSEKKKPKAELYALEIGRDKSVRILRQATVQFIWKVVFIKNYISWYLYAMKL